MAVLFPKVAAGHGAGDAFPYTPPAGWRTDRTEDAGSGRGKSAYERYFFPTLSDAVKADANLEARFIGVRHGWLDAETVAAYEREGGSDSLTSFGQAFASVSATPMEGVSAFAVTPTDSGSGRYRCYEYAARSRFYQSLNQPLLSCTFVGHSGKTQDYPYYTVDLFSTTETVVSDRAVIEAIVSSIRVTEDTSAAVR